jgi:lysophospholipase L1-like esterase
VVPGIFRIGWLAFTLAVWGLVLYFASHTSGHPALWGKYSYPYAILLAGLTGFALAVSVINRQAALKVLFERRYQGVALCAAVVGSLALVEAFLRLADPAGLSVYEEVNRYQLEKVADPTLVYRHRRSWATNYQGTAVRFNELGLRDEPVTSKADGELRILFLGDSILFGWGVEQDKILSYQLQRAATRALGRPVRVINTGVGSYNTLQELRYLQSEGFRLQPDVVLLMYVSNDLVVHKTPFDPWTEQSFEAKSPPQVIRLLLLKSWLYRLAIHVYGYSLENALSDGDFLTYRRGRGWEASMTSMTQIVSECAARRIPLGLFYFRWGPSAFEDSVLEDVRLAAAPVPVQDVSGWFGGKTKTYFNSPFDPHPNAEGHRILATHILEYVIAHKLVETNDASELGPQAGKR